MKIHGQRKEWLFKVLNSETNGAQEDHESPHSEMDLPRGLSESSAEMDLAERLWTFQPLKMELAESFCQQVESEEAILHVLWLEPLPDEGQLKTPRQ